MPRFLILLLISSLGIGINSCAATPLASLGTSRGVSPVVSRRTAANSSLRSATENLQVRARGEAEQEIGTISENASLPTPPGVDPVAVSPRLKTDPRAWMTLPESLKDVASRTDTFDPPPAPEKEIMPEVKTKALRLYTHARVLAQDKMFLQAITEFLKALELDPNNPRILRELARNYVKSGNSNRAVTMFEQLIRHEPDNEMALFIVGLAAAERRNYELTVATLGRPLISGQSFTHDPGSSVLAHYHLARALGSLGYDRAASQSMRASLQQIVEFDRRSRYRQQIASIFRRQAEMWQFIGDTQFRILEYEQPERDPTPDDVRQPETRSPRGRPAHAPGADAQGAGDGRRSGSAAVCLSV